MKLLLSSNLLNPAERETVFRLQEHFADCRLGVEVFPHFHEKDYHYLLNANHRLLTRGPVSFHEPYYHCEHTAPRGTSAYHRSLDYCCRALESAQRLGARHMVFHFNNCKVDAENRRTMLEHSWENLEELAGLARHHGVRLLIENTGVAARENVLYNQQEFVELFRHTDLDCLLDIGHANCNGWDLPDVMEQLSGRIRCYHLHNNFADDDTHNQIMDGTLEMERFFSWYGRFTPDADLVLEYRPELMDSYVRLSRDILYVYHALGVKGAPTPMPGVDDDRYTA